MDNNFHILQRISAKKGLRVYIHFPYCLSKCPFCGFPSIIDRSTENSYLKALIREVDSFSTERPIVSIYFGGGNPSLISQKALAAIIDKFKIYLQENTEITIEVPAEACHRDFAERYSEVGINRISIGVQSFLPAKLRALNRKPLPDDYYPPSSVSISMDIIIGTIYDDLFSFNEATHIIKHRPDHISMYPLSLERDSYYFTHPPEFLSQRVGQHYVSYGRQLSDAGYQRYEASNFYKDPSNICIHNAGYWLNEDFIGFGVTAHSKVGRTSWHNTFSIDEYIKTSLKGDTKKTSLVKLTAREFTQQKLLMGLRLSQGFPFESLVTHQGDNCINIMSDIEILLQHNYISITNGWIKSNPRLNFESCLNLLRWHSFSKYAWKIIIPNRISPHCFEGTHFP